jgi:hypothetical protein
VAYAIEFYLQTTVGKLKISTDAIMAQVIFKKQKRSNESKF